MARNEDYIDDMVSFVDLISFKDDLSDTSTVRLTAPLATELASEGSASRASQVFEDSERKPRA